MSITSDELLLKKNWYVYILHCADNSLYTGITIDLQRRLLEHNGTRKGAKYTSGRTPVKLIYHEIVHNRSEASKRERQIKALSTRQKWKLIEGKRQIDSNC